jgi:hypothetical protein
MASTAARAGQTSHDLAAGLFAADVDIQSPAYYNLHEIPHRVNPMDAAYISAFAALAGTANGGLTSFATSWTTQQAQARAQRLAAERDARAALFGRFLDEAAKLYTDALQNRRGTALSSNEVNWRGRSPTTGRQSPLTPGRNHLNTTREGVRGPSAVRALKTAELALVSGRC